MQKTKRDASEELSREEEGAVQVKIRDRWRHTDIASVSKAAARLSVSLGIFHCHALCSWMGGVTGLGAFDFPRST